MADVDVLTVAADGELLKRSGSTIDGVAYADLGSAWTAWTPQIDQGATTNIAKTVTRATYEKVGKTVRASVYLALTAGGTANAAILVSLPVTSLSGQDNLVVGAGFVYDLSAGGGVTGLYGGIATLASTTRVGFLQAGSSVRIGATSSAMTAALASGDLISFQIQYEVA